MCEYLCVYMHIHVYVLTRALSGELPKVIEAVVAS